jgi:hypothetical protein
MMPIEVGIWRMGKIPEKIQFSKMENEKRLEDVLSEDISILDPNWLLIGRQVPTDYGKFIDLLALDREGHLIIIELKKDKTPREVVAQLLDYGSWVRSIGEDDIASVFENLIDKYNPELKEKSLDEVFCNKFGVEEMPDSLNDSHELVLVAASLDDSTERIISYLTDFGVAINAVFFNFFKDKENEYLSRAWLIEPDQAEEKILKKRQKLPWNGEYYVSFGHNNQSRNWDDAVKYGFISAGGGEWYSRTLYQLETGGRIWVNIPKRGYVGVGTVKKGPVLAKDFLVMDNDGKEIPITEADIKGNLKKPSDNLPGTDEYLVRVEWIKTVPIENAIKEKGFFGNQNSAAKPRAKIWQHTVDRLSKRLDVKL